jgi:hypothetical protein
MDDSMIRRRAFVAGALIALLPGGALAQQAAPPQGQGALAVVRGFYVAGFREEHMPKSATLQRRFAAAMANSRKLQEPVSGIDFAWTTGSQDEEPGMRRTLAYRVLEETGARARVEARFRNGGPMTVTYALIREGGRWVVDDIRYSGTAESLGELLDAGAKAN